MEVQNSTNLALNLFKQNAKNDEDVSSQKTENKEKSFDEIIEDSAVEVSLSLNAQYILFEMNSSLVNKNNILTQSSLTDNQKEILDFLSGKKTESGMSLKDIGYEGKPIMELTQDEAQELVSEEGFFGITQTSDRVANFVFNFAGDDLELLQKGREGIVQGFEDAKKLFGGDVPEISYKTQERTLSLIDERINSLKEE